MLSAIVIIHADESVRSHCISVRGTDCSLDGVPHHVGFRNESGLITVAGRRLSGLFVRSRRTPHAVRFHSLNIVT